MRKSIYSALIWYQIHILLEQISLKKNLTVPFFNTDCMYTTITERINIMWGYTKMQCKINDISIRFYSWVLPAIMVKGIWRFQEEWDTRIQKQLSSVANRKIFPVHQVFLNLFIRFKIKLQFCPGVDATVMAARPVAADVLTSEVRMLSFFCVHLSRSDCEMYFTEAVSHLIFRNISTWLNPSLLL